MTRLPNNFEIQSATTAGGKYFKATEDVQEFRILSEPITGFEYFRVTEEGKLKPKRQVEQFEGIPEDSKDGKAPKQFIAFVIWNHNLKRIQIAEWTQKVLMRAIEELQNSADWGDPTGYDLSIKKTGKGTDTKYTLTPLPKSRFESEEETAKAFKEAESIRLDALFDNEDPFNPF